MALTREKIEHLEHRLFWNNDEKPWKDYSRSRRWLKRQMNKFIRLSGKKIDTEEVGRKVGRKPYKGWEY